MLTNQSEMPDKVGLEEADIILGKLFINSSQKMRQLLLEKMPEVPEKGVLFCTRLCIGSSYPDKWFFNEDMSNLIFHWKKDNDTYANVLPAPGTPLLILLNKTEYAVGHYADATFINEDGDTVMVYRVYDYGKDATEDGPGEADKARPDNA